MRHYLAHLFIPYHTNNFKPRLLHGPIVIVYAILMFTLNFSFSAVQAINPDILGFATNITIDQLLTLTNQKRAEAGLGPLRHNPTLAQAAAGKAADMFGGDYWAHNSPAGKTPWDFIVGSGYSYIYAGENLAKNFQDSPGVVEAWMNSPTHKENLLRAQYEEVGFAIVNGKLQGEETTLVVQMFGTPQGGGNVAFAAEEPTPTVTPAATSVPSVAPSPTAEPESTNSALAGTDPVSPPNQPILLPSGGVVNRPAFDIVGLTKRLSLGFSLVIMGLLVVDGIYVWRKKIVRISGRTFAHVMFISAISGAVWFATTGSIL